MNEQSIFLAALEIADPDRRAAYLDEACGGDPALRKQVEALFAAHQRSGEFLDVPALKQMAARGSGDKESTERHEERGEIDLGFLSPSSAPDSLGRLGHYEVREVIGRGGCGIVLKAFDERLERVVAVKVMAPELAATSPARKRFLREARAAAAIRHENVISIYAVEDEPIPFLVMEYIAGQTLQQRLNQTGPLDVREVLEIGLQIARGLEAAHAMGLIHRDIKPANVLLEGEPGASATGVRIKITDFGLARTGDDASLTQSGVIAGTPLYMSPEQALGETLDGRADLFSLGSVLYVMCSGRPPFRAPSTMGVLMRVSQEQPRPIQEIIPEVPDWLVAIIARLHAKNPADRFASASEVADLLARCLSELERHGRVESLGGIPAAPAKPAAPATESKRPVATATESKRPEAATPKSPKPHSPARKTAATTGRTLRRRSWIAAAAVFVALLAGLGMTEATGVTNVRGTVIRLFSPDGTLVVEVDDPSVSVTIDGEEMVITGAGAKEIRLKPGQYNVQASKDGKLLRQELVTVIRNGRQVVRVSREAEPTPITPTLAALDRRPKFRSGGDWIIEDGELVQATPGFARLLFGDAEWTDYDFEVEAKSMGKNKDQGIGLLFRASDLGNNHQIDIGGWGATVTEAIFLKKGKWGRSPGCFLKIPHEHGRWYKVKIEVRGSSIHSLVDGKSLFMFNDETFLKGMIGLGTHSAPVRWRNLKVTAPDGKVLWEGFPELPSATTEPPAGKTWSADVVTADQRKALEWVLSVGGMLNVTVGKKSLQLKNGDRLPDDAFETSSVFLEEVEENALVNDSTIENLRATPKIDLLVLRGSRTRVGDEGLAKLATYPGLVRIRQLSIGRLPVTDAGMLHVRRFDSLNFLNMSDIPVTGAGLAPLRGLRLTSLWLQDCRKVDDAAADILADIPTLSVLHLNGTAVTPTGIAKLTRLPNLRSLTVSGDAVTDDLAAVVKLQELTGLRIDSPSVTDAGLARLPSLPELNNLIFTESKAVTDAGVEHIANCKNLRTFTVKRCRITEAGVKKLAAVRPDLRIEWDGGAIEPVAHSATWRPTADQQAFFDEVAKLPADEQLARVVEKLIEYNPGFDGKLAFQTVTARGVEEVGIGRQLSLIDLTPLRALAVLERLNCNGTGVVDLSPLEGMQLTSLSCTDTRISDLSPLKGMRLTELRCDNTRVSDLSPLHGMPLTSLKCNNTGVSDLSPLKGVLLASFGCGHTRVTSLAPLQGMPLTNFNCEGTRVSDLSPLEGMPLTQLICQMTRVSDLSPLEGMPLTYLDCSHSPVADLSPLKGMPLTRLLCEHNRVSDLTPLKGMPLKSLGCSFTRVSDLSPLKGMPLTYLRCLRTRVSDASPLEGMLLEELYFDVSLFDEPANRLLKSLPVRKPAAEFWKEIESRRTAAETFAAETAKLPLEDQVAAVTAKLNELNDGQVGLGHVVDEDALAQATLSLGRETADITPLLAFTRLKTLTLTGGPYWLDISCVSRLPLEELTCSEDIALKNATVLQTLQTLKTINGQPAAEYLDSVATTTAAERDPQISPTTAASQADAVRQELRRRNPDFQGVIAYDIEEGRIVGCKIAGGETPDLSPLSALTELRHLDYEALDPNRDAPVLREMESLETINSYSAATFRLAYPANKPAGGVDAAWLEGVGRLPAETQAEVVIKKLKELNPNLDSRIAPTIKEGQVVSLRIDVGDVITDLSPLQGLKHLRGLSIKSSPSQSWLTDLSPLAGLPLEDLQLQRLQVTDLSPLKGMPLKSLYLLGMPVTDLTPLAGMPLKSLTLYGIGRFSALDLSPLEGMQLTELTLKFVRVPDLSPLKGMPLTELYLMASQGVRDLSPLAGMPLETLDLCANWNVSDLTPLKGMPLKSLWCNITAVSDLSPLEGMPLQFLYIDRTRVSDLSPLKGMPLDTLRFSGVTAEKLQIVRGIESLKEINRKPAAEFWKQVDGKLPTSGNLEPPATQPADDPSTAAPSPNEQAEKVRDDLRRRNPDFKGAITFLVEDGRIVRWSIVDGNLDDLSPLQILEDLKELNYAAFDPEGDAAVVRQLTSLVKINGDSAVAYRLAYPASKPPPGVSDEWLETASKLPVKSRVAVVMEKLQELNPNFDGKHAFRDTDMFLTFDSRAGTDLSPLKALPELRQLVVSGSFGNRTWLANLLPLSGMPLTRLECAHTRVADLEPLKGMPLTTLIVNGTRVADLTPLAGMPLTDLRIGGTQVENLGPVADLKLQHLSCDLTKVGAEVAEHGLVVRQVVPREQDRAEHFPGDEQVPQVSPAELAADGAAASDFNFAGVELR